MTAQDIVNALRSISHNICDCDACLNTGEPDPAKHEEGCRFRLYATYYPGMKEETIYK